MSAPTRRPGFQPGESGNPAGKKPGTRNKATQMVLALMEDGAREIAEAVIMAAKNGDLTAARLVLDKLTPPARERPISLDLPDIDTAKGVSEAQGIILKALGGGELLPSEANAIAAIVEAKRKALETVELERRISALESAR